MSVSGGPRAAVRRLPQAPGVYRFRDAEDRVLYVGRAVNLRRRAASYWSVGNRDHLAPMVARIHRVEAIACDSEHEAAWLERNLLEIELPDWNRSVAGQEVPAYICLDPSDAAPRLCVAHQPHPSNSVRCFGPYLGGRRVRLVVSALNRAFPLSYAGQRLSGAARDFARVRRIDSGDRVALVGAVTAVLDQDPVAMRALREELLRGRDEAAADLIYELAAQLQAETEAVDWILAEQKVTRPGPIDLDVHGFANGVLVRFDIRGGRLCAAHQCACNAAAARARVAATPAVWRPFADRNAVLAASLAEASGYRPPPCNELDLPSPGSGAQDARNLG